MSERMLDYRFGWRWLLAAHNGDTYRLYGFTPTEERFWVEALPELVRAPEGGAGEWLLIDGDRCYGHGTPSIEEIKRARSVGVIASRKDAGQWRRLLNSAFAHVREYGLLPARESRVVVPLSSSQVAVTALGLHRPGRIMARLALSVARALARVGNFALLRGRVLLIATQAPDSIPRGAMQADLGPPHGTDAVDFALYLGTPDDNRKTVVLPLGPTPPKMILKVAETPKARSALEKEGAALAALAQSPVAVFIPKLQGLVSANGVLTLCQEYRPRRQTRRSKIDGAVMEFLAQLSSLNRQGMPVSSLLAALPNDAFEGLPEQVVVTCHRLHLRLQRLAESGATLWMHRSHGDFAPWNCAWTDGGLFVFDWEESQQQALALGDAFYYAIAPALLLQRNADTQLTLDKALKLGHSVMSAGGLTGPACQFYLALWLMNRVHGAELYRALLVELGRSWQ